jgi:hypothetical protein
VRKSDRHYNDLGGIDSRTNKLLQNPKFARGGKNFEYSFQDEIKKSKGWQHKIPHLGFELGLVEYKFRDPNTGREKSRILGVDEDGVLRRVTKYKMRLTKTSGVAASYSIYYNPETLQWRFEFVSTTGTTFGLINFTTSYTVFDLVSTINGFGIGVTAALVDEDGNASTSIDPIAYRLDTVYQSPLFLNAAVENESWSVESVVIPSGTTLFSELVARKDQADYEGLISVSLNNSLYMTDGAFPMKYDGYAAYRAGMPHFYGNPSNFPLSTSASSSTGFSVVSSTVTGGGLIGGQTYKYKFQFGFVDPYGVEILGKSVDQLAVTLAGANNATTLRVPPIRRDNRFPVFACKINGNQDLTSASRTFNVASGHNIRAGMFMRIPILNVGLGYPGFSYWYAKVETTTATSITLIATDFPFAVAQNNPFTGTNTLYNGQWINGGYTERDMNHLVTDPFYNIKGGSYIIPDNLLGAFVRVYRSQAGSDSFYHLIDLPLQYYDGSAPLSDTYTVTDDFADMGAGDNLSRVAYDDTRGEQLPRACKYLSIYQNTLVQSGYPYSAKNLEKEFYPSNYFGINLGSWGLPIDNDFRLYNTQALLCDFQSVYWASQDAPEGFPQDGLHEFLVATKFTDSITGMIPNKDSFFVFKDRSTAYLTGTLADNNLGLEVLEADVGSVCHKVLQEVQGAIFFMDRFSGFWAVVAGRLPIFVGYPLEDEFRFNVRELNFKRAVGANYRREDKFVCFIPGNKSSVDFVYDYAATSMGKRSAWYVWDGVVGTGGLIATSDDRLLKSDRVAKVLHQQKYSNSRYDYSNHQSAIEMVYKTSFINFDLPVIDKTFLKLWISSIQGGFTLTVKQFVNYMEHQLTTIDLPLEANSANKLAVKDFVNLLSLKAQSIALNFENNQIHEPAPIQGWELEVAPAFDKDEARR